MAFSGAPGNGQRVVYSDAQAAAEVPVPVRHDQTPVHGAVYRTAGHRHPLWHCDCVPHHHCDRGPETVHTPYRVCLPSGRPRVRLALRTSIVIKVIQKVHKNVSTFLPP